MKTEMNESTLAKFYIDMQQIKTGLSTYLLDYKVKLKLFGLSLSQFPSQLNMQVDTNMIIVCMICSGWMNGGLTVSDVCPGMNTEYLLQVERCSVYIISAAWDWCSRGQDGTRGGVRLHNRLWKWIISREFPHWVCFLWLPWVTTSRDVMWQRNA